MTVDRVNVDRACPEAEGMTIDRLAEFLVRELQVTAAMNFDGGGSTTMYFDGQIVNRPSDRSCDDDSRCVYDGLFVYAK